jgi:hypothetical protein
MKNDLPLWEKREAYTTIFKINGLEQMAYFIPIKLFLGGLTLEATQNDYNRSLE